MKRTILVGLSILFFGCTEKGSAPSVEEQVQKPLGAPVVETEVTEITETKPPRQVFEFEGSQLLVAAKSQISNSAFQAAPGATEVLQDIADCGVDATGVKCLDISSTGFEEGVDVTSGIYYIYFSARKEGLGSQYLLVAKMDREYRVERVDLHEVPAGFETPVDVSVYPYLGTLEMSEFQSRLNQFAGSRRLYHALKELLKQNSDTATRDHLTQVIREQQAFVFEDSFGTYEQAIAEIFFEEIAFDERIYDVASDMSASQSLEARQLGELIVDSGLQSEEGPTELEVAALSSSHWLIRKWAVALMEKRSLNTSQELLILSRVSDENESVSRKAYEAALKMEFGLSHFGAIEELFLSKTQKVREFAVFLLASQDSWTSAKILSANLADSEDFVADLAAEKLAESAHRDSHRRRVVEHFENPRSEVRLRIAKVLQHFVSERALEDVESQAAIESDLFVQIELRFTARKLKELLGLAN